MRFAVVCGGGYRVHGLGWRVCLGFEVHLSGTVETPLFARMAKSPAVPRLTELRAGSTASEWRVRAAVAVATSASSTRPTVAVAEDLGDIEACAWSVLREGKVALSHVTPAAKRSILCLGTRTKSFLLF